MVPRTGTRARVPKTLTTSNGGVSAATTPISLPSIFTVNSSFFILQTPLPNSRKNYKLKVGSRQARVRCEKHRSRRKSAQGHCATLINQMSGSLTAYPIGEDRSEDPKLV